MRAACATNVLLSGLVPVIVHAHSWVQEGLCAPFMWQCTLPAGLELGAARVAACLAKCQVLIGTWLVRGTVPSLRAQGEAEGLRPHGTEKDKRLN